MAMSDPIYWLRITLTKPTPRTWSRRVRRPISSRLIGDAVWDKVPVRRDSILAVPGPDGWTGEIYGGGLLVGSYTVEAVAPVAASPDATHTIHHRDKMQERKEP